MAPRKKGIVHATAFITMCILKERENLKKKKRKHKFWMSHFLKTRNSVQLLSDLKMDDRSGLFTNFSRMSQEDFQYLISLIGLKIGKKDTNYRDSIPVELRLAITLRFLATGDSYNSLMYLFRVSKPLISKIIPEVCAAIVESLKEYIKVSINFYYLVY